LTEVSRSIMITSLCKDEDWKSPSDTEKCPQAL